ncbi:amidase [Thermoflavimicrobium daqui]|jgi:Asp-tRNA(Asn)/Glu-tRNA(Gln) amidotransferase A subunit family amidase|uniref:Amidase n=1 Tax=Thermoflavimicrobium daqui TaxID=2137476 RepID=A0A364K421_9BACL|nr:amidase [Thermoflavimicrobium daqui]RAL24120.1 amidase [Thermoflavimicrobium daqui]
MESILSMSATILAQKIASQEVTSLQATETYIAHIQRFNPKLNLMVEERFHSAREEAKEKDQMIQNGRAKGKLFGVPVSVKESFFVKGMKTTSGLPSRKNCIDSEDAQVIKYLKEEGAIILGKTNTPTFCFCQETDNTVYGRSNNPWDITRTVGGSSGGEAALIAVGGAAVGIGQDIGGSIRFPAHFNGVIGFKSGDKQVSDHGCYPPFTHPFQIRMLGIGAFAKSVADAQLIHEIISELPMNAQDLSRFTYIIPKPHSALPIQHKTAETIENIFQFFSKQGTVIREQPPFLLESALWWQLIMSVDGAQGLIDIAANSKISVIIKEFLRAQLGMNHTLHPFLTWAILGARMFQPSPKQWKELEKELAQASAEVDVFLRKRILILPVYHSPAGHHGKVYQEIFSIRKTFRRYMPYISYANTFGLPSLSIPVSEDPNGMPIGVQLITSAGQEHALFIAGEQLEKSFRGYQRCTYYDHE